MPKFVPTPLLAAVSVRSAQAEDSPENQKEQLHPADHRKLLLTSELLTWVVGNLSAFCFKTGGCDHITDLKSGARE